ncbi:hypothetical protein N9230_04200, partial [Akkermansiaceae bacterium]|nr:hypothetical protein [Akkermansiaceae bacterium]
MNENNKHNILSMLPLIPWQDFCSMKRSETFSPEQHIPLHGFPREHRFPSRMRILILAILLGFPCHVIAATDHLVSYWNLDSNLNDSASAGVVV